MICSVIITAYNNTEFILDCIKSISSQKTLDNWCVRLYIGVDACITTAKVLNENNINYYWTDVNVGTYVLSNSLIYQAKNDGSDIYVRFDSDDVADKNFLFYGIENTQKYHFFRPYCIKCDNNLQPISKIQRATGSAFFNNIALDALGGYQNFRVACDTDLHARAVSAGFIEEDVEYKPTYFYRQHPNSLMNNIDTSKKSSFRKLSWQRMTTLRNNGLIKVNNPSVTKLLYCN